MAIFAQPFEPREDPQDQHLSAPPQYRETHPIRLPRLLLGLLVGGLLFSLFGKVAWNDWTMVAGLITAIVLATTATVILALRGDRGVALGLALITGVAISLMAIMWAAERLG